jgi:hypothetical protein
VVQDLDALPHECDRYFEERRAFDILADVHQGKYRISFRGLGSTEDNEDFHRSAWKCVEAEETATDRDSYFSSLESYSMRSSMYIIPSASNNASLNVYMRTFSSSKQFVRWTTATIGSKETASVPHIFAWILFHMVQNEPPVPAGRITRILVPLGPVTASS